MAVRSDKWLVVVCGFQFLLVIFFRFIRPSHGISERIVRECARPHPRDGTGERHCAEHDRYDWRGSVHHYAAHAELYGRTAGHDWLDRGSTVCGVRRDGLGGARRGHAGIGRVVSLSARNLWAAENGTADFVLVHLATFIF